MMISPGTPRIQRSRGTMLASFLSAGLCGRGSHRDGRALAAPHEIRLPEMSRGHYGRGLLDAAAHVVTAKAARRSGRLRAMDQRT